MTKFECLISDLETICKLISLKGVNAISGKVYRAVQDMLIEASPNGLSINAMDILRHIVLHLDYKVKVIEAGPLPIGDIEDFEKFLQRFNITDAVMVSTTENRIIIERTSPKKIAKIPMDTIDNIESKDPSLLKKLDKKPNGFYKTDKLNFNLKLAMLAEEMSNVIADGEVVKQRNYPWVVNEDKLTISIGNETSGEILTEISLKSIESDPDMIGSKSTKTGFSSGIDNIFANLSGLVTIFIADNSELSPLILEQSNDKYFIAIALAPFASEA